MNQGDVLAVLAAVVLIGAALVAVLRTDRVREARQQRLKAVTAMAPIGEQPTVSLRRPLRQGGMRGLFAPFAGLWVRLDATLAATGVVATAVAVLLADRVMRLSPVLVILLGFVAAIAAPILLLRFAQSR